MTDDLYFLQEVASKLPLEKGEKVEISSLLSGGVISLVGAGQLILDDGSSIPIAMKYTKDNIGIGPKFSPIDSRNLLLNAPLSHDIDAKILKHFQGHEAISVPKLLRYFPNQRVSIMKNFNSEGFSLMQEAISNRKNIDIRVFENLGKILANLRVEMPSLAENVTGVEDRILQIEERLDELRLSMYDNRMEYYNSIWSNILDKENSKFTWTDSHPKNIAIKDDGSVIIFDFGRSIIIDPDYVLGNFSAHIFLPVITGAIKFERGRAYVLKFLESYVNELHTKKGYENFDIDTKKYIGYTIAEIAHRGKAMRWIDPRWIMVEGKDEIEKASRVKYSIDHLVDQIFSRNKMVSSLDEFINIIWKITDILTTDSRSYCRPELGM